MKGLLFIMVSLTHAFTAFSQASIRGKIKDKEQNLISATVLLLSRDSVLVKGTVTDLAGEFIFEDVRKGDHLISASMVGYSKFMSPLIQVRETNVTLEEITLEETATELGEVTVSAKKPLYDQQIDRLVVNVGNSILSSGNTILEVFQKSPGIVVNRQTSTISLNARSPVKVMINEKLVQLPLDVVMQMLDGMSASNVERIELITTPPAKYDAEGNGGIIHIVTKENEDLGTYASFGLTVGAKWAETFGGNFDLHHRGKKVAYFMDYSILRSHNLHTMRAERKVTTGEFVQTVNDFSERENITTQQNLNMGAEWRVGPKTLMTLSFSGYRRDWELQAHATDLYSLKVDSTVTTDMDIHESNVWQSATTSLGILKTINAKSNISASLDYLYYHNNNPSQYDVSVLYDPGSHIDEYTIELKKSTPIQVLIGKVDYRYEVSPLFSFEVGAKAVTSILHNNVIVQRGAHDVWTVDSTFTSSSRLDELITAAYISTQWTKGQWQINSGIRYEYTHTSITTPSHEKITDRRYGKFFPTLMVKKTFDGDRDVQWSYSRRITRPTYNDIAPFVFFWGPNTFSAGNTSLYPSISDAVLLGYRARQWILSLQYTHTKNEITFLQPEIDPSTNLIYRSQNLHYLNTLALTNSYSISVRPGWEIQGNLTAQYQVARTLHLSNDSKTHLYGVNINLQNQMKLPKGFSIEVSGMYQSKLQAGISQYLPFGALNAGVQKDFGKNGVIRLSVDDVFNTNNWRIKTYSPENNIDSYFNYNWHNRYVRLTYTRNLGNSSIKAVRLKSASDEERRRVN